MYSYISGTLAEVGEEEVVIDNHGIGYRIFVPKTVLYRLSHVGEQVTVYTYLNVREDALQLYGFSSANERKLFQLLLGVNGIGPRGALAILSVLSAEDLRFAILAEDAKAIAAAPGIGGKTAQRVILDLKDKIDRIPVMGLADHRKQTAMNGVKTDVIEALTSLGYSSSQVVKAMEDMDISEDAALEEVIKDVLKKLSFL